MSKWTRFRDIFKRQAKVAAQLTFAEMIANQGLDPARVANIIAIYDLAKENPTSTVAVTALFDYSAKEMVARGLDHKLLNKEV